MPVALFISPHLDDVAFSCGGTFAKLARAGWQCVLLTVFTRSVPQPTGFALACQTDKGFSPEVDYLALRRQEDTVAARHLGATTVYWLDLPEAPHRGYHSPPALFADLLPTDHINQTIAELLADKLAATPPQLVFAPQGLGLHVDHRHVMQAVCATVPADVPVFWYRDTPYIIRQPDALPAPELPAGLSEVAMLLTQAALTAKVAASQAYASQIGFQFGGSEQVQAKLSQLASAEGLASGLTGAAERFAVVPTQAKALPGSLKPTRQPSGVV
ncbi:PIG-L family deacetylase [Hymenobacter sp. YC55]|uniref:PIG-L deacetylase family protein n=1 Tax=Hymenobacter sp. YC55 TaxID=3034019 RepID=UPI0023F77C60|nr:PIG-L family deacetylase [Hymenobacter sp. YC55]MDF7814081.1 PIG-L family deacetylase [Hymenobacter sp. YC55]